MRSFLPSAIIIGTMVSAVTLLMAYNYARFGSPIEFGMKHLVSMYSEYLRQGNFFRYDHVPYNIWAYFFSLPLGDPYFPYVKLPFYILKVQSVSPEPYLLVHVNELCASVFCLMPVLLFCFVLAFTRPTAQPNSQPRAAGFLALLLVLQLAPLCIAMPAISRYCYDFLPIMMILAFQGIERVKDEFRFKNSMLVMISLVSVVFSFAVVVNCSRFYEPLYRSPLLRLW